MSENRNCFAEKYLKLSREVKGENQAKSQQPRKPRENDNLSFSRSWHENGMEISICQPDVRERGGENSRTKTFSQLVILSPEKWTRKFQSLMTQKSMRDFSFSDILFMTESDLEGGKFFGGKLRKTFPFSDLTSFLLLSPVLAEASEKLSGERKEITMR